MKLAVNTLVITVAILLSMGVVMLYSSSVTEVGNKLLIRQGIWCGLGLLAFFTLASLDYQLLKKYALPLTGFAVLLLLAVFLPHIGHASHGAHRWIGVGSFTFQSSEVAKLVLLVLVAWYAEKKQRKLHTIKYGIVYPALLVGPVLALIFFEPDRGTTILLAVVVGSMLLIAGLRWLFALPVGVLLLCALIYSLSHDHMRSGRIYSWQHVEETRLDKGMQAYQAWLALGSGGVTGVGLGDGRQTVGGWVPEQHTDFILATVGEQWGLVATLGVVAAFIVILWCGLVIAVNARDTFGTLLAAGLTLLICFQAFVNIGVVISFLPNKGLPLPFISYGGSNLLMMLAFVGVLCSIAKQGEVMIPSSVIEPEPVKTSRVANPFAP
ncbi:MAG: Lipid flippase FtsW, partial [Verrucomicrobiota bacterium]